MTLPSDSSFNRIAALFLRYFSFCGAVGREFSKSLTGQLCRWWSGVSYPNICPKFSRINRWRFTYFSSFDLGYLFRSHISYTLAFLEEMWSRNLGNLFVAPLRSWELIALLSSISLIRTLIGMVPAALLAISLVFPFLKWGFLWPSSLNLVLSGWRFPNL